MNEQKPNRKPDQIFVRKGLATPSPGTEQELEHLSLYQEALRESGMRPAREDPFPGAEEPQAEDEVAPAGSLLAVDMRKHTGRAWIEARNGDGASSDYSSLLLRQGNLPLDTPVSADDSTAKTWKRLREEFGDEAKESEQAVRALPSWSEIKESLAKEDGPEKAAKEQEEAPKSAPGQDDQADKADGPAKSFPAKRIDLIANAEAHNDSDLTPPAEPTLFAEQPDRPEPAEQEPTLTLEPPLPPVPPQAAMDPSRGRSGLTGVALGLAALAAIGAGLWFQFAPAPDRTAERPSAAREEPQSAAPAESAGTEAPPEPSTAQPFAPEPALATPDPATAEAPAKPTPAEPTAAPAQDAEAAPPVTAEPADASEPAPIEPSFDLVRIEPDGQAVIAGRAEPFTDLIILDNGEPIGTARSNAEGEWAFIPDEPLPPGEHQIAMVVNTPQGEVVLPNPSMRTGTEDAETSPAAEDGAKTLAAESAEAPGDLAALEDSAGGVPGTATEQGVLPVPPSKPETVIARALPPYGVQLSSNTSRQSAENVWQELQLRFPDLLGDKTLMIQEVELDQSGTRFRVQTGLFDDLASARKLCQAFAEREQECLVFKR